MGAGLLESMAGAGLTCVPAALYKKCEPIATKTLTAASLTPHNRFATVRPWPLLEDRRSPGPTWPTSFASAIKPAPCCCSSRPYGRSEEHTSELQSRLHLVCRLEFRRVLFRSPIGSGRAATGRECNPG